MQRDTTLHEQVILGFDDQGQRISVPVESLMRGTHITGLQGTGKSNLLKVLFWQIARAGAGVMLIDPHGDVSRELLAICPEQLAAAGRFVYLDASDPAYAFGLNLFEVSGASVLDKQRMVDHVLAVFKKLFALGEHANWGPLIEVSLSGAAQIFADTPGMSLTELLPFFYDAVFRDRLVAQATTYPDAIDYWQRFSRRSTAKQQELTDSTERKVLRLTTHPLVRHVVGQSHSTLTLRQLMDERKVVLVRLAAGEIGPEAFTLLGTLLVSQVLTTALSRADSGHRPPFVVLVDELQTLALPDFAALISQARKFNVGLVTANQYLEQLDPPQRTAVLTAVNRVAFQVSSKNARALVDDDYFMAVRKPGPAVRKPKSERVVSCWTETYWDPPAARDAYQQAHTQLLQVLSRKHAAEDALRDAGRFGGEKVARTLQLALVQREEAQVRQRLDELKRCEKQRVHETDLGYEQLVKEYNQTTGRYEPVYVWEEGELQSVSAAKTELSQLLAHLPERQALMRVRVADGTLWQGIVRPPRARTHAASAALLEQLVAQSRQQYYRPRADIEAEITRRRTLPMQAAPASAASPLPEEIFTTDLPPQPTFRRTKRTGAT